MSQRELETSQDFMLPRVEFSIDRTTLHRGEKAVLSWKAGDADEVNLWASPLSPLTTEPLDWVRIEQMGQKIAPAGRLEIAGEETTAYYLVARTPRGVHGIKDVVEVVEDGGAELIRSPELWKPELAYLERMEERPHILLMQPKLGPGLHGELWVQQAAQHPGEVWMAAPPSIWVSAPAGTPHVILADETFTCSYAVANATCITLGSGVQASWIVIDTSKVSGTKIDGGMWGGGGSPYCAASANGALSVNGPAWITQKHAPSYVTFGLTANNATGQSAAAYVLVDVLSVPKFTGAATNQRIAGIRQAVKEIKQKLHSGCILNNTALDQSVAAFKQGQLKRSEFWRRLMAEVLCMGNITFSCKDVGDAVWGAGHWQSYTNQILLEWSPKHTPYLEYVILHELVHKCGFHDELYKYGYTKVQIEQQAHTVSEACYP